MPQLNSDDRRSVSLLFDDPETIRELIQEKRLALVETTLDFGKRFIECKDARLVKADPAFIALREDILRVILGSPNARIAA